MGTPSEIESIGDLKEDDSYRGNRLTRIAADLVHRTATLQQGMESASQIALKREVVSMPVSLLKARKIIYPEMKNRIVLEAFRELRNKLLKISSGENFVVMLTAVKPRSGTSFCTLNVATAFAMDDTRTSLVVDCNQQNPVQHKYLNIDKNKELIGLTDYIEAPNSVYPENGLFIKDIIYPTGIERVSVVPWGQQREALSEYVASVHMGAFFAEVRSRYPDRFMFVDAPVITDSSDARILADLCDMVVLCVPYGQSTRNQIAQVAAEIGDHKLAGAIFLEMP